MPENETMDADKMGALILWSQRLKNPDMAVTISAAEAEALVKCADYLGVEPALRMIAPKDAAGNPRGTLIVSLVDRKTGDTFRAIESDAGLFEQAERERAMQVERDAIPGLVADVLGGMARGEFSDSLIRELCTAATNLVKYTRQ